MGRTSLRRLSGVLAVVTISILSVPVQSHAATLTTTSATLSRSRAQRLVDAQFTRCDPNVACANVPVPLDYANPTGPKINLFVSRRRARSLDKRIGVLFVNPGGPGGPAFDLVRSAEGLLEADVLNRFDIIGVDPRGTERSTPLKCAAKPPPDTKAPVDDPTVVDAQSAAIAELRQSFHVLATRCSTAIDRLVKMDTETAARDLDAVRAWLREPSISFLGLSYGTYLGSVYTALFPNRMRVAVLDSALNPDRFGENMILDPILATDAALDGFLAACTSGALAPCPFNNGTDLSLRYASMRNKYISQGTPEEKANNAAALDQTVADLVGYPLNGWPILGRALNELDTTGKANFDRQANDARVAIPGIDIPALDTFSDIVNVAINCRDGILPRSPDSYAQIRLKIPTITARFSGLSDNAIAALPCVEWPAPVTPQVPLRVAAAATLVVANRFDLTTPLSWSQSLATKIGAPLLIREGGGHVAGDKSGCVRDFVNRFFIDGTPPPPGATCAS
jgi:pimeloyl-ACP methyl ester carboxylesterase